MMTEEQKRVWEQTEQAVQGCQRCALCQTRTHTVFGRGSENAKILFIGEAPGEQEDREGKAFVGAAGQLLDRYLAFIGLEEDDYYIANILKCRPPRNRDPLPEEEEACLPYLKEQLSCLQPKILVCLGRIAAQRIISPDFRITKQRGTWFQRGNMKIIATYHPSALLRDPYKKTETLSDFKMILKEWETLA